MKTELAQCFTMDTQMNTIINIVKGIITNKGDINETKFLIQICSKKAI